MTTKKERAERVPADRIVKRSRDAQKLPANLEAFARGDDDALWRRDVRGGKVNDPRMIALIPGLKNSDARMVYESHVDRIRSAMTIDGAEGERQLAKAMAVVHATASFRGYSIVNFEVFAEAVIGIPADRAFALARAGRMTLGIHEAMTEADIAVWLRAEAGVRESSRDATVEVTKGVLTITMPLEQAAEVLAAVGFREAPIARAAKEGQGPGPRTVVDRPAGVPSMRSIVEREERTRRGDE